MARMIAGLIFSYLLGSIPNAYIFAKMIKGIDLRQHGSGNLGATNAFRALGKGAGTTVLTLDILKGLIAVLLSAAFFYQPSPHVSHHLYLCLTAIAVVAGHNWTIFLNFKGGKGMATSLGTLIALSILIPNFAWVILVVMLGWVALFVTSGFVSLGSVICSAAIPFVALFFRLPWEIILFLAVLGGLSLIRHKANIQRLLQKKEHRFNTRTFFKKR